MIRENVTALLKELEGGNLYGERVTLVAATKTRSAEEINEAIGAGITDIGENKVQEFTAKFNAVHGCRRHFIGHLQLNKVKYLIGKVDLIESVDRDELAGDLAKRSVKANIVTNILIEVNIGCEESKSGYPLEEAYGAYERLRAMEGLKVKGFMAMLPLAGDEEYLGSLVDKMRALFNRAKQTDDSIEYLSMGMSGDWRLCIRHGSNMVRLGTAIFGERHYPAPAKNAAPADGAPENA